METLFLFRRGRRRQVTHLAMYDRHGRVVGSWCGKSDFNVSCNLPMGRRVCKFCRKAREEA